ncbi:MAG: helix-turn-helix transcriptional regulator [Clostridia bacterium]|nr:helix-turn-helix transcriptional regulator [Clostridia bacterium]
MVFHQPHNSMGNYNYNARVYTEEIWQHHFHKNLELICVLSGEVRCEVTNRKYLLKSGDFGLCLPYDVHAYTPGKNTKYYVCVFSADYVRLFEKQIKGKNANGFVFTPSESIKDYLYTNLINSESPSVYTLKSCLYAVCGEFLKNVTLSDNKDRKQSIIAITEYLEKNHTHDIGLKNIAELLGYDYNYVSRYFHSVFDMSFAELLGAYRLETAIKLMDETDKKIADIAFESGFGSVRTFNYTFKKHFGISPKEYRKNT